MAPTWVTGSAVETQITIAHLAIFPYIKRMRDILKAARAAAAMQHPNTAHELLTHFRNIELPGGAVVAGYMAIGDEINPAPIMEFLTAKNFPLCLPVTAHENAPLEFHAWHSGAPLTHGKYHIPEPKTKTIVTPDVLLVPLLGFDRRGNRIGYGKGYYDRTLADLRKHYKIMAIGLAYAEQEVDDIIAASHDQPLNIIVTPRETIYCRP